jgi:tRNA-specific 2-thiouridylase
MSGGVDSSVAAALLWQQGHEVIGLTMRFQLARPGKDALPCGGNTSAEDAQRVCRKLGIRHYSFDFTAALEKEVIADFLREYRLGRTPNPCVRCNRSVKFNGLLKKAASLGARLLATGHYARIKQDDSAISLLRAKDLFKDQSYFLYRLSQRQLHRVLFPLGDYTKIEIRSMARELGLPVADKPDSQEICFLGGQDYRQFLQAHAPGALKPGPVLDTAGRRIGSHKGIALYTIGQREGLGIALGYPAYVSAIDPRKNTLTVGRKEDVLKKVFLVKQAHFIGAPLKKKVALMVKIRYNHKEAPAWIIPHQKKLKVVFKEAQFAVTPGQSAVFYNREAVAGGGIIDTVLE